MQNHSNGDIEENPEKNGIRLPGILGAAIVLIALVAILFLLSGKADAALNATVGDTAPAYIGPVSEPVCVLNVTANNDSQGDTNVINSIKITVHNDTGFDVGEDLAALTEDSDSGIAVYEENGNTPDFQADEDTVVGVVGVWNGNGPAWDVVITFSPGIVIDNNSNESVLYVVVRTSGNISNNDEFHVSVNATAIGSDFGAEPGIAASSGNVEADTEAPYFTTKFIADFTSPYIFYNSLEDVIYYGNDMEENQTLVVTLTGVSDALSMVANVTFPNAMGDSGKVVLAQPFSHSYNISAEDVDAGTVIITIYDNVGNFFEVNLTFQKDAGDPTIHEDYVGESSDYIYFEENTHILYYGDGMTDDEELYVFIDATDVGSGLWSMEFPVDFTSTVAYRQLVPYNVSYDLSSDDETEGSFDFLIHDRVNNTAVWNIMLVRDVKLPTANLTIDENSSHIHYNDNIIYYGSKMEGDQSLTLGVADDDDKGSGIAKIEFPGIFGLSSVYLPSPGASREHFINKSHSTSGKFKIVVIDNVFNSLELSFSIVRDTTAPECVVEISEFSDYLHFDIKNNRLFYGTQAPVSQSFDVKIKMGTDDASGIYGAVFPGLSGPSTTKTTAPYSSTYTMETDTQFQGILRISLVDNVGNTLHFDIELIQDTIPPETGNLLVKEVSDSLHYLPENNTLFYSPLAELPYLFTVELADYTDNVSGLSHAFFPFVDDAGRGTNVSGYFRYTYTIPPNTTGNHNLMVIMYDFCGNRIEAILHLVADGEKPAYEAFTIGVNKNMTGLYLDLEKGCLYISFLEKDLILPIRINNVTDALSGVNHIYYPPIEDTTGGTRPFVEGNFSKTFDFTSGRKIEGIYIFKIFDNVGNVMEISLLIVAVESVDAPVVENRTAIDENGNVTFSLSGIDSPLELDLYYKFQEETWISLGKYIPGEWNNVTINVFNKEELKTPGSTRIIEFQVRDPLSNVASSKLNSIVVPEEKESEKEDEGILGSYVLLVAFLALLIILLGSLFLVIIPHKGPAPETEDPMLDEEREKEEEEKKKVDIRSVELEEEEGEGEEEDDEWIVEEEGEWEEEEDELPDESEDEEEEGGWGDVDDDDELPDEREDKEEEREWDDDELPDEGEEKGWDDEGELPDEREDEDEGDELLDESDDEYEIGEWDDEDHGLSDESNEEEEEGEGGNDEEEGEYECPDCGASLGENDAVCPHCGAEFEEDDDDEVKEEGGRKEKEGGGDDHDSDGEEGTEGEDEEGESESWDGEYFEVDFEEVEFEMEDD